jgi:hypothetical protein
MFWRREISARAKPEPLYPACLYIVNEVAVLITTTTFAAEASPRLDSSLRLRYSTTEALPWPTFATRFW